MAHISDRKESRFLTKNDCGAGKLLTIDYVDTNYNIAGDGEPAQIEWVAQFKEPGEKPFILKSVNLQLIAGFLGTEETDNWGGKRIVLYHDPSVTMKGKVTGGIRARAPKPAYASPGSRGGASLPPAAEAAQEATDEQVPF